MKKLMLLFLLLPTLLSAQEKGVQFTQDLSWNQVKARAKAENKYIMMDCYTTWCVWCKYMDKNIYPLDSVAQLENSQFISVQVQFDTSGADTREVKKYYALAHELADKYNVHAYPTFLFFDPQGNIVQKTVGASLSGTAFIQVLKDAKNPDKQYYSLLKKYESGDKDPVFLKTMALAADASFNPAIAEKASNDYLATQQDLYSKDNLNFISEFTKSSGDRGFDIVLHHADKLDAVMGSGTSDKLLRGILLKEDIYPVIFPASVKNPKELPEPDWSDLQAKTEKKYPGRAAELVAYSKLAFYKYKTDWEHFAPAVVAYLNAFGSTVSNEQLNDFAWTVFQNCPDMHCVEEALAWSKQSFAGNNNPAFIDTYANILYKMGRNAEAIEWETKASVLANGDKTYLDTIDKMKKGIKTWD